MRDIAAILGVLTLAGCASGPLSQPGTFLPAEQYQHLEKAKICCSSYREIRYTKLERGSEAAAAITAESPVFEFDGQRSFFAGFELPASSRSLLVKTYPVNMLWNRTGHVLIPAVQFLDGEYKPIETVRPNYVARNPPVIGRSWGEAEVQIPSAARYVLLFEAIGMPGLSFRDSDQRSGYLSVRSGPTGELSVRVPGG